MELMFEMIDQLEEHIQNGKQAVDDIEQRVVATEEAFNRLYPTAASRVWGLFRRPGSEDHTVGIPEWEPISLTVLRDLRACKFEMMETLQQSKQAKDFRDN